MFKIITIFKITKDEFACKAKCVGMHRTVCTKTCYHLLAILEIKIMQEIYHYTYLYIGIILGVA